jgi:hypothetical protein
MRRRLRVVRRSRDARLLELGALAYELNRRGRQDARLVEAAVERVQVLDAEERALVAALEGVELLSAPAAAAGVRECGTCRAPLHPGSRFCASCGAPVAAGSDAPPRAEHGDGEPGPSQPAPAAGQAAEPAAALEPSGPPAPAPARHPERDVSRGVPVER